MKIFWYFLLIFLLAKWTAPLLAQDADEIACNALKNDQESGRALSEVEREQLADCMNQQFEQKGKAGGGGGWLEGWLGTKVFPGMGDEAIRGSEEDLLVE